jgi:hypothetical protein
MANTIINKEQSIKDFLSKPVVLTDGLLQSGDNSTTFPAYCLMDDLLTNTVYTNKLTGFLGFRATSVITLQINATRFTQGRYMLNFYPTGGTVNLAAAQQKIAMHNFSLTNRTQVPGIQIDLNCETQATLKIPYISSYLFHPLRSKTTGTNALNIGILQLQPYVPANNNTTYTLYVHFEDIELIAPTVPQMGSIQEKERASANIGPVSTTLRKITRSSRLIKDVPLVGPTLSTLGWYSDLLSKVADVWGWSKPNILTPPTPMFRHRGFQNHNVDGADVSAMLSLSVKNELAQEPSIFGTDIDEMSFDYLKTIPAYFAQFSWNTIEAKEILKYSLPLSPTAFCTSLNDTTNNNIIVYPPVCMGNFMFSKYRGSFVLTIKAVKTEFHSGRLVLVYVPYTDVSGMSAPTTSYSLAYYANRTVIDLRYGTEWSFTLPWTSETFYKDRTSPYGTFQIYIENPLVAPASVSSSITILMEVSGAPDFEWACPQRNTYSPYRAAVPQSGGQFECEKIADVVGSGFAPSSNHSYSALAMGEKFTSIRQLLKRMELKARLASPQSNYVSVVPFATSVINGTVANTNLTVPTLMSDSVDYFSPMYAMARGGMRLKFWEQKPASVGSALLYFQHNSGLLDSSIFYNNVDIEAQNGPKGFNQAPVAIVPVSDGLTGEVQVPMYSDSYAYPTADAMIVGLGLKKYNPTNACPDIVVNYTQSQSTNTINPYLLRGVADDFSLGYFISTVPVVDIASVYTGGFI